MSEHITVRSFRQFITDRLPAALAAVAPLSHYMAEETGPGLGRVTLSLEARPSRVTLVFDDLPFPRADGSFIINGGERAVVMSASSNNLEEAEIRAVGEQLMDEIKPRLAPPPETEWDEQLLRAWFPLDRWLREFLCQAETSMYLDNTNWLARRTHLRRIYVTGADVSFHASHIGRVCAFETPEDPNCGRYLTLATGADVQDGKIVPAEDREDGALGPSASLIPLLCHNDPTRVLLGANMMRQWLPLADPEAPLVRSGHEPEDGRAFLGRNLLTAYIHWKGMNYEDAIVVSQSTAARLASPEPLEVGDKLSNRHGAKGVVGAILPDDEMPHLPDGRPVDLVFDPMGVYSRLNFGQMIEAVLGLVAEKRGERVIAPPFGRTTPEKLHAMLREAGLPESGQFALRAGKDGSLLAEPSTVGPVYWGKLVHRARPKMAFAVPGQGTHGGMRAARNEYLALRAAGADENILDAYSTRSPLPEEAEALVARAARGFLPAATEPPSAAFRRAQRALRTAMVDLAWANDAARVSWASPSAADVSLAEPWHHPWRSGAMLTHIGPADGDAEAYQRVIEANDRLAEALGTGAHKALQEAARASLHRTIEDLFAELNESCAVRFSTRSQFTAKAVLAPGCDLKLGQVGLPEDIAWGQFSPLVVGKVGSDAVRSRSQKARQAVENLMAHSVVIINRAPTWEPTCITAFTPVMSPDLCIHLHPLCCRMFNADFDGDQAAIWLPISAPAQREALEKLTLVGHLRRDPSVVTYHLAPSHSILAGLSCALESPVGQAEIQAHWPSGCPLPDAPLTRSGLVARLLVVLETRGPEALLPTLEMLYSVGIAWATKAGASFSPFVGEGLRLPAPPASDSSGAWDAYRSLLDGEIMTQAESDPTLRAAMRAVRCGARGSVAALRATVGPWTVSDPYDASGPIRHGFRDGLTAEELWLLAAKARSAFGRIYDSQVELAIASRFSAPAGGSTLLRRAMTSDTPGKVFAEAAHTGESDPLTDPDVRLWAGLLPTVGNRP